MYDTIDIVERARANQVRFDLQDVEFRLGQIEHFLVSAIRLVVITSNCFINFGVHKPQVFRDAFQVMDQIHKDGYYPLATSRELFLTATANILGQRAFGLFVLER